MQDFMRLFRIAAFSALAAGGLLALMQQIQVVPLIAQAEVFEQAAQAAEAGDAAWAPADGLERTLFTAAADIVVALGFALLLVAVDAGLGRRLDLRRGLLWGVAGYGIFFLAPSLGLPPEVPGTEAAALGDRQAWWLLTVACTAGGLGLIVFRRALPWRLAGLALIVAPHAVGAPRPEVAGSVAPEALAQAFVVATAWTNAVFWLALGGLVGYFSQRSERPATA